jgi:hypothetical protein
MRNNFFKILVILTGILSSFLPGLTEAVSFEVSASGGAAHVSGFTQIPKGGTFNTSFIGRPTLEEVGVNHTPYYNVVAEAGFPYFGIYGGYEYIRPKGNGIVNPALISHGLFFPLGTFDSISAQFDLYKLGIDHHFYFADNRLTITPEIELTVLNFNDKFTTRLTGFSRHFSQVTPRVGIRLNYAITPKFSAGIMGATSLSLMNLNVYTAKADLNYDLIQHEQSSIGVFAGVGYQQIDFKDHQQLPNHIRLSMAPIGEIGLKIRF